MQAPVRLLQNVRHARAAARLLVGAGACALLAGCAGGPFRESKVDPQSPIAAEATQALHARGPYPRFADFPAKPTNVRPKTQYGAAATQVAGARDALLAATAPDTWTLTNTGAFADTARAAAGPATAPADPAQTAAFADALRKRATPPPPPKR